MKLICLIIIIILILFTSCKSEPISEDYIGFEYQSQDTKILLEDIGMLVSGSTPQKIKIFYNEKLVFDTILMHESCFIDSVISGYKQKILLSSFCFDSFKKNETKYLFSNQKLEVKFKRIWINATISYGYDSCLKLITTKDSAFFYVNRNRVVFSVPKWRVKKISSKAAKIYYGTDYIRARTIDMDSLTAARLFFELYTN
jgi:hypothetical protein